MIPSVAVECVHFSIQITEAEFKEKHGPYTGADYTLTLSHSLLRSPAFHPIERRIPTNVSPVIEKMELPTGTGRV
jgi:hypothetical protein